MVLSASQVVTSPYLLTDSFCNFLIEIKDPYERLVVPLGGISWVMDLMRHDDSRLYDFGSQLMPSLLEKKHAAPEDLIATPGFLSGLAQLLSRATASDSMNISCIWFIARMVLDANRPYLHDIVHSGFLSNIAARLTQPFGDYDVVGAATAMGGLTYLAYNARALDHYAPNIVDAAVALCQMSERTPGKVFFMVFLFLQFAAVSITKPLFDRVDLPALFARFLALPDGDQHAEDRANALWYLFRISRHFDMDSPAQMYGDLSVRCAQVLVDAGGWALIRTIFSEHTSLEASIFQEMLGIPFRSPWFIKTMGGPPTRQWCTEIVELRTRHKPLTTNDFGYLRGNLKAWAGDFTDIPTKIDALQAAPDQLAFVRANMQLAMSLIAAIDPDFAGGTGLGSEVQRMLKKVLDAVERACPRYARSAAKHKEAACPLCMEKTSILCDRNERAAGAVRTPEDALSVLSVLLTARILLMLVAVYLRGQVSRNVSNYLSPSNTVRKKSLLRSTSNRLLYYRITTQPWERKKAASSVPRRVGSSTKITITPRCHSKKTQRYIFEVGWRGRIESPGRAAKRSQAHRASPTSRMHGTLARAAMAGIPMKISDYDEMKLKRCLPCRYSGYHDVSDSINTLDRILHYFGYSTINTVSACLPCNLIKGKLPFPVFLALDQGHHQGPPGYSHHNQAPGDQV
ncbi:hypothetical protein BC828DRAFT_26826 [Blastocladiella britannica]|nr:hypothetical protein BC828DRAFT_26826 [Blastocladiella britannica]